MHRRFLLLTTTAVAFAVLLVPVAGLGAGPFTDVPDDHVFKADIDWLAATGVTRGCNPPANDEFCPDRTVTRGQMAAFMRRLAESRAVDAGTVGGLTVEDLEGPPTAVGGTNGDDDTLKNVDWNGPSNTIQTIPVNAPADGYLVVNGFTTWRDPIDSYLAIQLDDTVCDNNAKPSKVIFAAGDDQATVAVTAMVEITAGAHTLSLCAGEFTPAPTQILDFYAITAVFSTRRL